jgi:ketosteroid isomerase-like protein
MFKQSAPAGKKGDIAVYKFVTRQVAKRAFQNLNKGDWEAVVKDFDPNAHFVFAGQHEMALDCHGVEPVKDWFRRTYELLPDFHMEPKKILVNGPPWDMWVASLFEVSATLDGEPYSNGGLQLLHLRWGKVLEDFVYEDSHKLALRLESHRQTVGGA